MDYDKDEFARIKKAAAKIQSDSDVLLVVGIGGSYLGARAAIEFLSHSFYNVLPKSVRKTPEIYFVGKCIISNDSCCLGIIKCYFLYHNSRSPFLMSMDGHPCRSMPLSIAVKPLIV